MDTDDAIVGDEYSWCLAFLSRVFGATVEVMGHRIPWFMIKDTASERY